MRAKWFVAPWRPSIAAGCGSGCGAPAPSRRAAAKEAPTIALFLPESKTTRYEAFDRPLFEAKVKALCADCKLLYNNADQDAAKQQQQVESALTQGADVLVLDAVDAERGRPAGQPGQAEEDPGRSPTTG